MDILTYHGKSEDVCLWVIESFDKEEFTKYNETTRLWVEASKERLRELGILI
jgi:hypothetical protein